jgi:hypothetical protein
LAAARLAGPFRAARRSLPFAAAAAAASG